MLLAVCRCMVQTSRVVSLLEKHRKRKAKNNSMRLFPRCSGYCTVRLIVVVWLNAPDVAVTTIDAVPRFA